MSAGAEAEGERQGLRDLTRRGVYREHAKTMPSHPDLTGRRGRPRMGRRGLANKCLL
jgi:hypothetical protein